MVSDPITAVRLRNRFRAALARGRRRRLWRALRGRRGRLLALAEALGGRVVTPRPPATAQVPLREIRGSVHRAADYSAEFLPLRPSDEDRWVHVAAGVEGPGLPPVRLLRYRGDYFVEDGHHRVSVLRALGAASVPAEVVELVDAVAAAPPPAGPAARAGQAPA